MPPRVATPAATPSLADAYFGVPPVTRTLATGAALLALATKLGLVSPYALVITPDLVLGKLQLWRLLPATVFLGPISFGTLIQLVWLVQYGRALEDGAFVASTADFAWCIITGAAALAVAALAIPALGLVTLAPSLVFMLLYVWARHNPTSPQSIMGLVTLPAVYLPWAFLALAFCGVGGSPAADGAGLIVGHLYYFLTAIHPAAGGRRLLATPAWLVRALARRGVGRVAPPVAAAAGVGAGGFRAFGGTGRRLAD